MSDKISQFVEGLSHTKTVDTSRTLFQEAIEELGYSTFTYVSGRRGGYDQITPETFGDRFVIGSTFPVSWRNHYRENGFHSHDPVITLCGEKVTPLAWAEVQKREDLTPKERRVVDEARDFGLHSGASIPIHATDGGFAITSIVSGEQEKKFERMFSATVHDLHVMAIHYHAHLSELAPDAAEEKEAVRLSPREIECIKWTAVGKTAWEISQILGISENTVNFHLKNCMAKLEVHSKTHAAAKAVSLGIAAI